MYNKHLDAFITVAETGSFARAAEACNISRTALLQQINLLEEHVGFPLFHRGSRGVSLTPMGREFEKRSREILRLSADTIARCRSMQNERQIRIGIVPNMLLTLLEPICIAYVNGHPEVKIQFVERNGPEYMAAFLNNEFDLTADYMSRVLVSGQDILFTCLGMDCFHCAVPPQSALAEKEVITLEALAGHRLAVPVANVSEPENRMRRYLQEHGRKLELVDVERYKKSLPLSCVLENTCFLHYRMNAPFYKPLLSKPLDVGLDIPIEVGMCCKPDAPAEVQSFLKFAQRYCRENGILQ